MADTKHGKHLQLIAEARADQPLSAWPPHDTRHERALNGTFLTDFYCLRCRLEEVLGKRLAAKRPEGKPSPRAVDLMVGMLSDLTLDALVLVSDIETSVYLVAAPLTADHIAVKNAERQPGDPEVFKETVEYQVADGPPGKRSHSEDFYDFYEAHARFQQIVRDGWPTMTSGKKPKRTRDKLIADIDACFCIDQHSPPDAKECDACVQARKELAELDKGKTPPNAGGCWYCHTKTEDLVFSVEFDTYVHRSCLEKAATDPADREAAIMTKELLR